MLLGCIGDDFTGSSDLANTLAKGGLRVVQYTGVPRTPADDAVDAGIVALKTRSTGTAEAVRQALDALDWLRAQGCSQFFFKYCSTFDSTPEGNIGPVAEALAMALDAHKVIVCPAFPGTGRSVYQGHLFVNDRLLDESGMQHHPLTPMTDPDIRRWLQPQTSLIVGHVDAATVLDGAAAIVDALEREHQAGKRLIVVDALRDADLVQIGAAAADLPLVTGGSGVASGLPANFASVSSTDATAWPGQPGPCAVLSGSCSDTTREQVAVHSTDHRSFELSAEAVIEGRVEATQLAEEVASVDGVPLVYSSADPAVVADVQRRHGRERVAACLETFFAELARELVASGVTRLVTAGGETSGAIVEGLGLDQLAIGPEIAPGVPAVRARDDLVLALKSGNFGAPDFFAHAARTLAGR